MAGSTSDTGPKTPPKVAEPTSAGSRSVSTPTSDADATTKPAPDTVTTAAEVKADAPVEAPVVLQTPDELALDATPRTGPLAGDDPEANPSHPSSLRIRNSDGEPVLKTVKGGVREIDAQQPGFEAAETPQATPSHPSSIEPDPSGVSGFRLVNANAEQPESDSDDAADRSPERVALAKDAPKGTKFVTYTGTEAVTLIVPESGGYDGVVSEGHTVNFRPGQTQAVPSKAAGWLLKHPRLTFTD